MGRRVFAATRAPQAHCINKGKGGSHSAPKALFFLSSCAAAAERFDLCGWRGCCWHMITHVVVFWVKPEVQDGREQLFAAAREHLPRIPGVQNLRYGASIPSERPVVDTSYTMAISMDFASQADLDTYQQHPEHLAFIAKVVKPLVERVLLYDFSAEPPFAS